MRVDKRAKGFFLLYFLFCIPHKNTHNYKTKAFLWNQSRLYCVYCSIASRTTKKQFILPNLNSIQLKTFKIDSGFVEYIESTIFFVTVRNKFYKFITFAEALNFRIVPCSMQNVLYSTIKSKLP